MVAFPEIGRFFFAWLSKSDEPFDPIAHARVDEDVAGYSISESEGSAARLTVKMRLPRGGLLSSRINHRWALVCVEVDGEVEPWFRGRLVSFPTGGAGGLCDVEFVGRPFAAQKVSRTVAGNMKDERYWHDLLVPVERRDDPDEIMEGRASTLHWNRMTHDLRESDIEWSPNLINVDGWIVGDPVVSSVNQAIDQINITVEAEWEQSMAAILDLGAAIRDTAPPAGYGGAIKTFTPDALASAWNSASSNLGGAYEVLACDLAKNGQQIPHGVEVGISDYPTGDAANDDAVQTRMLNYIEHGMAPLMQVKASYRQKRREAVKLAVKSSIQPVMTDSDLDWDQVARTEDMYFRLEDIQPTLRRDVLLQYSIGKADSPRPTQEFQAVVSQSSFFAAGGGLSELGHKVLRAAAARARARLIRSARCIEIEVEVPFALAWNLTCNAMLRIASDYLPGGEAVGKVISYELVVDGVKSMTAHVRIGCCAGKGGMYSRAGTLHIGDPKPYLIDEPVDVATMELSPASYLISQVEVIDGPQVQVGLLDDYEAGTTPLPDQLLTSKPTQIVLKVRDLTATDEIATEITVAASTISMPTQINTAAEPPDDEV